MSSIQAVTQHDFQTHVIESELPVLLDFWADWCAPCHRVSPILEELASDYAGRVRIAKVNVDEEADLASRFGVRSMPTFLFLRGGEVVDQVVGARSRAEFEAHLDSLVGG